MSFSHDTRLHDISAKVKTGERLSFEDGVALFGTDDLNALGKMFGTEVHWGFGFGIVACLLMYLLMNHTVIGFASRIVGGNIRAARVAGLHGEGNRFSASDISASSACA